jgi:hypothetical protein
MTQTGESKPKSDITWVQFLALYVAVATVNGSVRYAYGELSAPPAEQILFYAAHPLFGFLVAAILVGPLHLIGKRMTTGMQTPKRTAFIWGCIFATVLLIRFMIKR